MKQELTAIARPSPTTPCSMSEKRHETELAKIRKRPLLDRLRAVFVAD